MKKQNFYLQCGLLPRGPPLCPVLLLCGLYGVYSPSDPSSIDGPLFFLGRPRLRLGGVVVSGVVVELSAGVVRLSAMCGTGDMVGW